MEVRKECRVWKEKQILCKSLLWFKHQTSSWGETVAIPYFGEVQHRLRLSHFVFKTSTTVETTVYGWTAVPPRIWLRLPISHTSARCWDALVCDLHGFSNGNSNCNGGCSSCGRRWSFLIEWWSASPTRDLELLLLLVILTASLNQETEVSWLWHSPQVSTFRRIRWLFRGTGKKWCCARCHADRMVNRSTALRNLTPFIASDSGAHYEDSLQNHDRSCPTARLLSRSLTKYLRRHLDTVRLEKTCTTSS